MIEKQSVTFGITHLDTLIGGLFIGDNVVWYDDAGSLALVFCHNFIQSSQEHNKPIIYISFDRSPSNLLERLGDLTENPKLIILDCFTNGKGESSEIFSDFYTQKKSKWPCRIIRIEEPHKSEHVVNVLYGVHQTMEGDVRLVFESLTGMQDLWGGEEHIQKFYSRTCPRLYELNTIAYWIIEKEAHSNRLKAFINQIAQVAIELSLNRGKTSLTFLKAEKRNQEVFNKPFQYWNKGLEINFDINRSTSSQINIGTRIKEYRAKRGLSQKELAKQVGVTPSTISQVESNSIYPSIPALFKIAEILSVDLSTLFHESGKRINNIIFSPKDFIQIQFPDLPKNIVDIFQLIPENIDTSYEAFLIDIKPGKSLSTHFFKYNGEEFGYLLSGELEVSIENQIFTAQTGDVLHIDIKTPSYWKNTGSETARLVWLKLKS